MAILTLFLNMSTYMLVIALCESKALFQIEEVTSAQSNTAHHRMALWCLCT